MIVDEYFWAALRSELSDLAGMLLTIAGIFLVIHFASRLSGKAFCCFVSMLLLLGVISLATHFADKEAARERQKPSIYKAQDRQ